MRAILLWMLLLPFLGLAQDAAPKQKRLPFVLKTTPLNLINPIQQSVDAQVDVPISPRWGIELGVNVVVNSQSWARYEGESYKGLKVRPAIKYYFQRYASGDDYVSLAFKYNNIHNDRHVNTIRQGGQYTEWMLQRRNLVVWGAALRFGSQQRIGHRKRWIVEPFAGLGIRQLHVSQDALPPDAELVEEARWLALDREPGIYTTADLLLGFCVGWIMSAPH